MATAGRSSVEEGIARRERTPAELGSSSGLFAKTAFESLGVLRPVGLPGIEVRRELDADGHMVWTRPDMGGIRVVLERVGGVA